MKKLRKAFIIISMMASMFIFSGCSLGGNDDFAYMADRTIMKVSIQSTRDDSYKFIVTDKDVINDIYSILSKAMVVEEKSSLDPDYVVEIYESPTEVKTFNYVAGLDKKDGGNFYDGDSYYIVSKRLDNDIIKNFTNIRKPINFDDMYYNMILRVLDMYESQNKNSEKIGIVAFKDKMALKFQLSTEIEKFKVNLKKSAQLLKDDSELESCNVIMNIETQGYTSKKYKSIVTFTNKADNSSVEYYVVNEYKQGEWIVNITTDKPENF